MSANPRFSAEILLATALKGFALTLLIGFGLTSPASAFDFVMGTNYYPVPTIPLPAKAQPIIDPTFHSTVVRVTSKSADNYSGPGIQNEYAKADPENIDSTRLILRGNDGTWYLYNRLTYQQIEPLNPVFLDCNEEPEPRWDNVNPNVFYYVCNTTLRRYDITTHGSTVVHDFKNDFPGAGIITTRTEGDASLDRRYWCLLIEDGAWNLLSVATYDRMLNKVLGKKAASTFPDGIDWVSMDMSGNHCIAGYDAISYVEAFSRDLSTSVKLPNGSNAHGDLALTAAGKDVFVYQNNATDYISMADLNTGVETQLVHIPFEVNPDIGLHVSGNSAATPGWVLVSTNGPEQPPPGSSHSWMDTQLFMLELKAAPRIWRIAHTHCYTEKIGSHGTNYFAEAFAAINTSGTRIYFGSNWGDLTVQDYEDAYQVQLPTDWVHQMPGSSPTATPTRTPTPTPTALPPHISNMSDPILVGGSFNISGTGFTPGSWINFFVSTAQGPIKFGPLVPVVPHSSTAMSVSVPPSIPLGQGLAAVQVVNTDTGYQISNAAYALLQGAPAAGIPTIMSINGKGLADTSSDPGFATNNVENFVQQGTRVALGGTGFDVHGVAVDLFCDCPGGKVGPFPVNPGADLSSTQASFMLPAKGMPNSPNTGPGSFRVSNKGKGDYAMKSNAVSVPIGTLIKVDSVHQTGCMVTVNGAGFAVTGPGLPPPFTVINLFNQQAGGVVNLGGLSPAGIPKIPLNVTSENQFTFSLAATGFVPGPAYVQVFNPPFVPYSSSDNTINGSFTAVSCGATPTPTRTPTSTPTRTPTPTPTRTPVSSRTPTPIATIKLTTFQAASLVLGQPDFTHNGSSVVAADSLSEPYGGAFVYSGRLFVGDYDNSRVLGFAPVPMTNGPDADLVLGQTDFISNIAGDGANQMNGPTAPVVFGNRLVVDEYSNNRVLIWNSLPTSNDMPADVVLGQPGFGSSNPACSANGMTTPEFEAVTPDGKLIVADNGNSRILIYNHIPATNGAAPNLIVGQNNATTCVDDNDGTGLPGFPSASNFHGPTSVWSDGTRLAVVDQGGNRVLIWNTFPTTPFQKADVVLGQPNFVSDTENNDGMGVKGAPSARNLYYPYGVFSNGAQVFVADTTNNRVLVWNTFPTANFQPADVVLGQPGFTCGVSNGDPAGSCKSSTTNAKGLFHPNGAYQYQKQLFITDGANNRYLVFMGQ